MSRQQTTHAGRPVEIRVLRVRVSTRLGLDVDIVGTGALDGSGDVGGIVGTKDGDGGDGDAQVVGLDPGGLVEGGAGVGDAVGASGADGVEARPEGRAGSVAHVDV